MSAEPFPQLSGATAASTTSTGARQRRRQSSGLGAEIRGDVDVGSFATARDGTPPPGSPRVSKTMRRSRRSSALHRFKRQCIRHTWLFPLVLGLLIVALYLVYPYPSNPISACLFLSYPLARSDPLIPASVRADPGAPTHFGKGARDFAFVGFYMVVLSFTREFFMQRVIRPVAVRYGIRSRDKQSRFMEQAYTALYFAIYGPLGLWIMKRTPTWYFNTTAMYEGFPHRTNDGCVKAYYLLQASYWAQQLIVLLLQLEKPRKDFNQLVTHHFVTIALIWCSYRFHFTYMGIAVYITHDISDFFLATSKCLNYINSPLVGPYFFLFMLVWAYLRHFLNLRILFSVLTEFRTVGPFTLNWDTQQYKCWISQYITFSLLAVLQAVNLFWGFLIARIAWRFVFSRDLQDDRSEYGESEVEEEVEEEVEVNGMANGVGNGTTQEQEMGSIAARVRRRKSGAGE